MFAVTFSIVFAYVADCTTENERSWSYGLVSTHTHTHTHTHHVTHTHTHIHTHTYTHTHIHTHIHTHTHAHTPPVFSQKGVHNEIHNIKKPMRFISPMKPASQVFQVVAKSNQRDKAGKGTF